MIIHRNRRQTQTPANQWTFFKLDSVSSSIYTTKGAKWYRYQEIQVLRIGT